MDGKLRLLGKLRVSEKVMSFVYYDSLLCNARDAPEASSSLEAYAAVPRGADGHRWRPTVIVTSSADKKVTAGSPAATAARPASTRSTVRVG